MVAFTPFPPCALSAAIVVQPGVGVARTELNSVSETLLQYDFKGVVDAAAGRHIAPIDVLVLGIAPQRLRHVSIEGSIR